MKVARSGLIVAIAIGLLAGATVGVAARSEDGAPSGFSGWVHGLPQSDDEACSGRLESVGAVEQVRDYRCEQWLGTTDPRFTGTYVQVGDFDTYHDTVGVLEDGSLHVSTMARRVENDDGAWEATPTVEAWWLRQGDDEGEVVQTEVTIPIETVVFSGEGGYEGLTAVVWLNPFIINSQLWGVIFTGEPPQAPQADSIEHLAAESAAPGELATLLTCRQLKKAFRHDFTTGDAHKDEAYMTRCVTCDELFDLVQFMRVVDIEMGKAILAERCDRPRSNEG